MQELDDAQRASRLTKLPGLHSFLGYALFFPSVLVGPSFDFQLYHSLVNGKLFVDAEPTGAAGPSSSTGSLSAVDAAPGGRAPLVKRSSSFRKEDVQNSPEVLKRGIPKGRKRVAYVHGAVGVAFLAGYALLGSKANYEGVLSDEWKGYSAAFKCVWPPNAACSGHPLLTVRSPFCANQAALRPGLRLHGAHQVLRRLGADRGASALAGLRSLPPSTAHPGC